MPKCVVCRKNIISKSLFYQDKSRTSHYFCDLAHMGEYILKNIPRERKLKKPNNNILEFHMIRQISPTMYWTYDYIWLSNFSDYRVLRCTRACSFLPDSLEVSITPSLSYIPKKFLTSKGTEISTTTKHVPPLPTTPPGSSDPTREPLPSPADEKEKKEFINPRMKKWNKWLKTGIID